MTTPYVTLAAAQKRELFHHPPRQEPFEIKSDTRVSQIQIPLQIIKYATPAVIFALTTATVTGIVASFGYQNSPTFRKVVDKAIEGLNPWQKWKTKEYFESNGQKRDVLGDISIRKAVDTINNAASEEQPTAQPIPPLSRPVPRTAAAVDTGTCGSNQQPDLKALRSEFENHQTALRNARISGVSSNVDTAFKNLIKFRDRVSFLIQCQPAGDEKTKLESFLSEVSNTISNYNHTPKLKPLRTKRTHFES
jgi:hypothetical protein